MSGIAGYINCSKDNCKIDFDIINRLSHRGKDFVENYSDDIVSLNYTHLNISDNENKYKMTSNKENTIISVMDGTIDNYIELSEELKKSAKIKDNFNTNIIPYLYQVYGTDMFGMLKGQFAIAIWDKLNKKLILARDKFGQKPLYYQNLDGCIYFGSEIVFKNKQRINAKSLKDICTSWATFDNETFYENVFCVNCGEYVIVNISGDGFNLDTMAKIYYSPVFNLKASISKTKSELVSELDRLLIQAIKRNISSDIDSAFYLSGGLDSSLVAAIASKYVGKKINTFSILFDNDNRETKYQDIMKLRLNSNHHKLKITDAMMVDCFYDTIIQLQTPVIKAGVVPMYILSENISKKGFKTAVLGQGADELFGGYDIFKEAKIRAFCEMDPESKIRPLLYSKTNSYINNFSQNNSAALNTFFGQVKSNDLFSSHMVRFRFGEYASSFFSDTVKRELKKYSFIERLKDCIPDVFSGFSDISKAQYLELKTFTSGYLLTLEGDLAAMAHGIECKYPFLDDDLVEFALKLNDSYKIRGLNEKYLLKEVAKKYLPSEIINRNKFPFRAILNHKTFLSNEKIKFAISNEKINNCNIFNNKAVTKFFDKIKSKSVISEKELMLLLFIASTQILASENKIKF